MTIYIFFTRFFEYSIHNWQFLYFVVVECSVIWLFTRTFQINFTFQIVSRLKINWTRAYSSVFNFHILAVSQKEMSHTVIHSKISSTKITTKFVSSWCEVKCMCVEKTDTRTLSRLKMCGFFLLFLFLLWKSHS